MADLRIPDLNRATIAGRLTRDPELRYLGSGTAVCDLGLAATRYYKGKDGTKQEETLFIDVTVWAATAEFAGEHLKKGRPILVEGRLKSDSWEDGDGNKRMKIAITGDRIQALDWEDNGERERKPAPRKIVEPVPEDDIPF